MDRQVRDLVVQQLVNVADHRVAFPRVGFHLDRIDQRINLRITVAAEVVAAVGAAFRIDAALQCLQ